MSQRTPENIESRYQQAKRLTQQSSERYLFNMGLTAVGLAGFFANMAIVSETYYQNLESKSNEEIIREIEQDQLDPYTQEALVASMGIIGFEVFCAVGVIATGYRAYQYSKYSREADRLLKHMEIQSKRSPTLKS